MKRIIARLYITIITVMILFGLIFLINEIRVSRNEYINESVKVSDQTKELIEENWFKHKNFENQSLSDSLKDFMNEHKNIHSIIIYSKDKGLTKFNSRYNDRAFLLNSLIPNDPSWNIRPEYSFNWWDKYNNNITSTPLQIDDRGFAFDLIYNVLSTEKVEKVFKDAFIIVLIFLILTIIVIIIFSVWKSKNSISEYDGNDEPAFTGVPLDGKESIGDLEDVGEPQSFSDLDMDFDDDVDTSSDNLDDFDMDFEDDQHTSDDTSDDLEDLDDFNIGSEDNLDEVSELDELDDFDMDFSDTSDEDEPESLDDFDMDFGENEDSSDDNVNTSGNDTSDDLEDLDDFDLDFEDNVSEPDDTAEDLDASDLEDLDDFDLDTEDASDLDDLDDFDLDTDDASELDELDDFDLDTDDTSELDELDDFDLDTDDNSELDELDDFDLDTDDTSELDELDDFDLDTDDTSELDDLDDFDLNTDETSELDDLDDFDLDTADTSALDELDDMEDLGDLTESLDDENKTTYDLDDFALESDENADGYDLEEFSLDSNDIDMDDDEELNEVKFKESSEIGPDLSSMLEKAGVAETDLSVIVVNIKDGNTKKQHDFLSKQFGEDSNVYELNDKQIVVTLKETEIDDAVTKIDEVLFNAEQNDLSMSIGVSSMSGRRVGENRLLGEALQAVQKAEESSKHMLAFRPDPDKYKDYIKNS